MTRRSLWAALVLAHALLVPDARAVEPEVAAVLSVMGYGHRVKVLVNGADTGVTGGKSQSMRLFSKNHSFLAKATPEMRARNFVLVPGANELSIEFTREPKAAERLTIEVEAQGYPGPLLQLSNQSQAAGKHVIKVQIEPKAPKEFKPVVISDSK